VGFSLLTGIYVATDLTMREAKIPFPGSLLGLVLCAVLVHFELMPLRWVDGAATLLLRHMVLFYLPLVAAVGQFWPLLRDSGAGLIPTILVTTGVVLITTGFTAERFGRRLEKPDVAPTP